MKIIADNGEWQMTHEPRCGFMAMPRWWVRQRTDAGWDKVFVFFDEDKALQAARDVGLYVQSPTD